MHLSTHLLINPTYVVDMILPIFFFQANHLVQGVRVDLTYNQICGWYIRSTSHWITKKDLLINFKRLYEKKYAALYLFCSLYKKINM